MLNFLFLQQFNLKVYFMNKIRKFWKDNGTPFFFHFEYSPNNYLHLNSETCLKYDKVQVQDDGCTAMDTLVDIRCIQMALDRCQDEMVISAVKDALKYVVDSVNYIVSINSKK